MRGSSYMRDPSYVRDQYASESNLNARVSLYDKTTGPFAGDVAFDVVAEGQVLHVGHLRVDPLGPSELDHPRR